MHFDSRNGLMALLCVVLAGLFAGSAVAATVSFQGQLTEDLGLPVTGSVEMVFTVVDAPDASGMISWQENQTVAVAEGIFNAALGAVKPFPEGLFEQEPLYLEIALDDPGSAEVLTPRQRVDSAGHLHGRRDPVQTHDPPGAAGRGQPGPLRIGRFISATAAG